MSGVNIFKKPKLEPIIASSVAEKKFLSWLNTKRLRLSWWHTALNFPSAPWIHICEQWSCTHTGLQPWSRLCRARGQNPDPPDPRQAALCGNGLFHPAGITGIMQLKDSSPKRVEWEPQSSTERLQQTEAVWLRCVQRPAAFRERLVITVCKYRPVSWLWISRERRLLNKRQLR